MPCMRMPSVWCKTPIWASRCLVGGRVREAGRVLIIQLGCLQLIDEKKNFSLRGYVA
jgi:hypothetical protein